MKAISKDFIREVKGTKSRFISILVLVSLAVAFLSGLQATAPDMKLTGHHYFEEQKLADVQIMSTVGLTDEDLDAVLALDQVQDAENCFVIDAFADSATVDKVAKVYSIPEKEINELLVIDGRMPEALNECVIEERAIGELCVSIGDKLTLSPQESFEDSLTVKEFTIVGTVRNPIYISIDRGSASIGSGSVAVYLAIPKECFDSDIYTTMFVRLNKPEELVAFYPEYDDYVDDFIDSIEDFGNNRAKMRYADLEGEIADGQKELDDAKLTADKELSDAAAKLKDAEKELTSGKKEVADAEVKIADAERQLKDAEDEIKKGEKEVSDGEIELADALKKLQDGEKEYEDGKKKWDKGKAQYDSGASELAAAERTLANAENQIAAAEAELNASEADLDAAVDGMAQIESFANELKGNLLMRLALGISSRSSTRSVIAALGRAPSITKATINSMMESAGFPGMTVDYLVEQYPLLEETLANESEYRSQIAAGRQEIAAGRAEIASGRRQISSGNAELSAAWKELSDGKKELADARKELDDGWKEYNDGLAELEEGKQKLADGRIDYEKGKLEVEDAKHQLADAKKKLANGQKEYNDGLAEYNEAKADADKEIADAQKKIDDARETLDDISEVKWYIFSRNYNPGYSGLGQDAERMANLASVFPVIFFLVAALVCLTTMTRMIEEQRIQIGSLKALGYGKFAITVKYIGYGFVPSIAGSIAGLVIGYLLFPTMIFTSYQIMYQVPSIEIHTYPNISVWCIVAAVACTTLASLAACLATLRETPARLMVPKTPQAGKRVILERVGFIWKRLSFNYKVTVRNLFRYKKRFLMTIIGIGGCTALLVSGFAYRYSLTYTMVRQYDELFHFDAQVVIDTKLEKEEKAVIEDFLNSDERVTSHANLRLGSLTASSDEMSQSVILFVGESDEIAEYVDIRYMDSGEIFALEDDGIYIDQKLSELLGVGVGDEIFLDGDNHKAYATIAGLFEHYMGHYCYMTPASYEKTFNDKFEYNGMLIKLAEDTEEFCNGVFEDLMKFKGIAGTTRMLDVQDTYQSSLESVDFVVMVIIVSAASLALVVLYNLSNINITERKRELATIKVLGFYDKEVSAYVYRENIILTLLGTAIGLFFGHYLHVWLVLATEIDLMMFGRQTNPISYVLAGVLTILFAILVNVLSHYKMKKIDMVESLKSAE